MQDLNQKFSAKNLAGKIIPDVKRQGEIKFYFAKAMPYNKRIFVIFVFFSMGFLIQMFLSFWVGVFLFAAGTLLSVSIGYDATPNMAKNTTEKWNQVTPDEFKKVLRKNETLKNWDLSLFDITNWLGFLLLVIIAGIFYFIWYTLSDSFGKETAQYFFVDVLVVYLIHWVTGTRTYLTKDSLIIKINLLLKIIEKLAPVTDIQVQPMLSTLKTTEAKDVPSDVRLMIKLLNAPEHFSGIQVQICINNVQGTFYPYLYCVVLVKKEAMFFMGKEKLYKSVQNNIVHEKSTTGDVEVLVIRQFTTKTSGYHTSDSSAWNILQHAIALSKKLMEAQ